MICNNCSHNAVCMHRASIQLPTCLTDVQFNCQFYTPVNGSKSMKVVVPHKTKEQIQQELLASRPQIDEADTAFPQIDMEEACDECGLDFPQDEIREVAGKYLCTNCADIYRTDK